MEGDGFGAGGLVDDGGGIGTGEVGALDDGTVEGGTVEGTSALEPGAGMVSLGLLGEGLGLPSFGVLVVVATGPADGTTAYSARTTMLAPTTSTAESANATASARFCLLMVMPRPT